MTEPLLVVEALTKRFGGFTAVDAVSFQVAPGEILGLLGPNGSGKSTTFNCIAGMLKPTSGSVKLAGREIAGSTADESCRLGIGRTFQIPRPFRTLSLLENAKLAAHYGADGAISAAEAEERARDALRLAQLPDNADAQVHGLGAAGLKKLELARALATQPKLLLADESLGGLDTGEMKQAADMLTNFDPGRMIWHGYTGAAGWMLRQAMEGVIGASLVKNEMILPPDIDKPRGALKIKQVNRSSR